MPRYLVTYNIVGRKPGAEVALAEKLKLLRARELFPSKWLLETEGDAENLRDELKVLIDLDRDGLFVAEMNDNAAFQNPWFHPWWSPTVPS